MTDKVTGDPLEGATVGFSGLMSGFGFDLSAQTASDGTYTIADVPDHDAYAAFVFTADGYEMKTQQDVVVAGDISIDKALFRDWAALSAGATLKSFTPPDYFEFCGTNANGAFDLNLGSGWPSDSVDNGDSGVTGPRKAIVRLPQAVDVTSFGVASGGACGDDFTAGVKHFQIQTRTNSDAPWKTAVDAKAEERRCAPVLRRHRRQEERPDRPVRDAVEPRRPVLHGRAGSHGSRPLTSVSEPTRAGRPAFGPAAGVFSVPRRPPRRPWW